jgi:NADH-quinone oxidoreductase subunit A
MRSGYLPLLIFLCFATIFPLATLLISKLFRPTVASAIKAEACECGIPPESNARGRYSVRFYVVAILFVIFDVETVFLFPWAVWYRALGWFVVAEAGVFLAILLVGYLWAHKNGSFDWV